MPSTKQMINKVNEIVGDSAIFYVRKIYWQHKNPTINREPYAIYVENYHIHFYGKTFESALKQLVAHKDKLDAKSRTNTDK